MGVSDFGNMSELVGIAEPNYGIITNVGKAHLDTFGSVENVLKEKGELYRYVKEKGGKVFINADNYTLV